MANIPLRQINFFDGTGVLQDGREVQIVMTPRGLLGVELVTIQDVAARVDQALEGGNPPPSLEGLDQIG